MHQNNLSFPVSETEKWNLNYDPDPSSQRSEFRTVSKELAPFCFCYNFVSRDQILVIFGFW